MAKGLLQRAASAAAFKRMKSTVRRYGAVAMDYKNVYFLSDG
jgi:hypothetical protein